MILRTAEIARQGVGKHMTYSIKAHLMNIIVATSGCSHAPINDWVASKYFTDQVELGSNHFFAIDLN